MGLDLILTRGPLEDYSSERQLAYGRKTWNIAHFFIDRCEAIEEEVYRVPREVWDTFIKRIKPYAENEEFRNEIENNEKFEWSEDFLDEVVEFVEDVTGDWSTPTLGHDWEAWAIFSWYDADREVRKAYDKGDDVILIVSY